MIGWHERTDHEINVENNLVVPACSRLVVVVVLAAFDWSDPAFWKTDAVLTVRVLLGLLLRICSMLLTCLSKSVKWNSVDCMHSLRKSKAAH